MYVEIHDMSIFVDNLKKVPQPKYFGTTIQHVWNVRKCFDWKELKVVLQIE